MLGANVESKTRCSDLAEVARVAASLGARHAGRLDQVDTYFHVARGRLKLREISLLALDGRLELSAELIRYERPDESGARVSTYERTEIADPAACRAMLEAEYGLRGRVTKRRELWLHGATRIQLDSVEGLGDFVELETVAGGKPSESDRLEHDRLVADLSLDPAATVAASYIDLLDEPKVSPPRVEKDCAAR